MMFYRVKLTALSCVIAFPVIAGIPHHPARAAGGALAAFAQAAARDGELSPEQRARLKAEIARVPSDLKGRFDVRYRAWKYSWRRKPILFSSNTMAARTPAEFRALISLGPGILPLLVDKIVRRDEFRALEAYDALQDRPELRVDPQTFPSEQRRALETAKRWLARM